MEEQLPKKEPFSSGTKETGTIPKKSPSRQKFKQKSQTSAPSSIYQDLTEEDFTQCLSLISQWISSPGEKGSIIKIGQASVENIRTFPSIAILGRLIRFAFDQQISCIVCYLGLPECLRKKYRQYLEEGNMAAILGPYLSSTSMILEIFCASLLKDLKSLNKALDKTRWHDTAFAKEVISEDKAISTLLALLKYDSQSFEEKDSDPKFVQSSQFIACRSTITWVHDKLQKCPLDPDHYCYKKCPLENFEDSESESLVDAPSSRTYIDCLSSSLQSLSLSSTSTLDHVLDLVCAKNSIYQLMEKQKLANLINSTIHPSMIDITKIKHIERSLNHHCLGAIFTSCNYDPSIITSMTSTSNVLTELLDSNQKILSALNRTLKKKDEIPKVITLISKDVNDLKTMMLSPPTQLQLQSCLHGVAPALGVPLASDPPIPDCAAQVGNSPPQYGTPEWITWIASKM